MALKKVDINDGKSNAQRIFFVLLCFPCAFPPLCFFLNHLVLPLILLSLLGLSDESVVNAIRFYSDEESVWGLYMSMF